MGEARHQEVEEGDLRLQEVEEDLPWVVEGVHPWKARDRDHQEVLEVGQDEVNQRLQAWVEGRPWARQSAWCRCWVEDHQAWVEGRQQDEDWACHP